MTDLPPLNCSIDCACGATWTVPEYTDSTRCPACGDVRLLGDFFWELRWFSREIDHMSEVELANVGAWMCEEAKRRELGREAARNRRKDREAHSRAMTEEKSSPAETASWVQLAGRATGRILFRKKTDRD